MLSAELLAILCCPETHQPLTLASAQALEAVNRRIAAGGVKNRSGESVSEKLEGALIRSDGQLLYPVRGGIPVMLIDQAIPLLSEETMFLLRNL